MGNNIKAIKQERQRIIQAQLHEIQLDMEEQHNLLDEILNLNAYELQEKLFKKDYKDFNCLKNLMKYFHRIKQIENNESESLTEIFYDKPIKRCQELQTLLEKDKITKETHPLLGFFISLRESLILKGSTSTHGFIVNLSNKKYKNKKTIKKLIQKGAIITCTGNVSQGKYTMECKNNLFGQTRNPYNKERSPGGTSGGEASLVRLGLVNGALGSDIDGSLRIPALFCGVVTIKPTSLRLSFDLLEDFFANQNWGKKCSDGISFLFPSIGPITRSVKDCEIILKTMINSVENDFMSPPLRWRENIELPKNVAKLKPFDMIEISTANQRALDQACQHLEKNNFKIVELDLNDLFKDLHTLTLASFFQIEILRAIVLKRVKINEPIMSDQRFLQVLSNIPKCLMSFVKTILGILKFERLNLFVEAMEMALKYNRSYILDLRCKVFTKVVERMKALKTDCLIAPGLCTPAIKSDNNKGSILQIFYASLFNFLNFPTGVVPITKVRKEEQIFESKFNDFFTKNCKEQMKGSEGLPIGVQVCSFPWRDEKCIKLMSIIEKEVQESFECKFQSKFKQYNQIN